MAKRKGTEIAKEGWSKLFKSSNKENKFDALIPLKSASQGTKILAWNVNGIRAILNKNGDDFKDYIRRENPDILCLSETKIDKANKEKLERFMPKEYKHCTWTYANKKGYSGTAIFSKVEPLQQEREFNVTEDTLDTEGRYLANEYEHFWLVHTYVPNAGAKLVRLEYRTKTWDVAMLKTIKRLESTKPVIWCGDLNVAHEEIDIHNPKGNRNKTAGFTDAERDNFSLVLKNDFTDVYRHFHPEKVQYTYWSYRMNAKAKNMGWRLDYFVASNAFITNIESTFVRDDITGSDHCPIGLILKPSKGGAT